MDYRLEEILNNIYSSDQNITKLISNVEYMDRGFCSKNIIDGLRTFVEQIGLYVYCIQKNDYVVNDFTEIKPTLKKLQNLKGCKPIVKLHSFLQSLASHYSIDEDASERAMLKYYSYLYDIRELVKQSPYNLNILSNLEQFPRNIDKNLQEYYTKIAYAINHIYHSMDQPKNRYYVKNIKEFYVENKKYYEITLQNASDYASKFNRIIVFSDRYVLPNYAIKASFQNSRIEVLNQNIDILVLDMWEVSIRGCEIGKLIYMLGMADTKSYTPTNEYYNLMRELTDNLITLNDVIELDDEDFKELRELIIAKNKIHILMDSLTKVRTTINHNRNWANTASYLIYKMNNNIFKNVLQEDINFGMRLKKKCYSFEQMPFVTSLPYHNPSIYDLIECIDCKGKKYELAVNGLLNRCVVDNTLYFKIAENNTNLVGNIEEYNKSLYMPLYERRQILKTDNGYYCYKEDEDNTYKIIKKLKQFEMGAIPNYNALAATYLNNNIDKIDSEEKKNILKNAFSSSRIVLINGAAGTGKSTLLSYLNGVFDADVLVLTVTNTALNNLRDKLGDSKRIQYKTIKSLVDKSCHVKVDLLIVDECSTVSNHDFVTALEKVDCGCIALTGDTYQIEAIQFGNWFSLALDFMDKKCCYELSFVHRASSNENLKKLWEKVRNKDDAITEIIARKSFSEKLSNSIFSVKHDNEVILCLNYSGLYGVNNINTVCQQMNQNEPFYWDGMVYKKNDPIIFNDSERFSGLINNNQKGKIKEIKRTEGTIVFWIKIDRIIKTIGYTPGFDIVKIDGTGTLVKIEVVQENDYDKDSDTNKIVPFDVAYAISIHKAQGLEFDSVKIVITDEIEERVTHNIFYTSITRAKKHLKIYWSPEVQTRVLDRMKLKDNKRDKYIFSKRFNLDLN